MGLDLRQAMKVLRERGLGVRAREMSTLVWGEEQTVFDALGEVFHQAEELDDTVMTVTLWSGPPATEPGRARLAIGEAESYEVIL